jgi:hypothetical protein
MIINNQLIIFRSDDKLKVYDLRNNKLVSVSKGSYEKNWGMIDTNIVIYDEEK